MPEQRSEQHGVEEKEPRETSGRPDAEPGPGTGAAPPAAPDPFRDSDPDSDLLPDPGHRRRWLGWLTSDPAESLRETEKDGSIVVFRGYTPLAVLRAPTAEERAFYEQVKRRELHFTALSKRLIEQLADRLSAESLKICREFHFVGEWRLAVDELVAILRKRPVTVTTEEIAMVSELLPWHWPDKDDSWYARILSDIDRAPEASEPVSTAPAPSTGPTTSAPSVGPGAAAPPVTSTDPRP
ncbi:DUF3597 domain-containing protein [Streptomyces physcomitrii]|uniref:DUF3597 domain-containing protein n=1 Tax=Streptomyces physcomitrii TaxID=2724184 RepID=A0ABX1H937_9ACTN|nr:DUF3597 domain-containing protein [Streptomyces physcomitrii]NKI44568.1 DUF3597 domain-containing protein [Streptomyces physcomitrii]